MLKEKYCLLTYEDLQTNNLNADLPYIYKCVRDNVVYYAVPESKLILASVENVVSNLSYREITEEELEKLNAAEDGATIHLLNGDTIRKTKLPDTSCKGCYFSGNDCYDIECTTDYDLFIFEKIN